MNAERHALTDAIRESRMSIKTLQSHIYDLELSSTKKVDVLEKDHKDYIELAYKIHLIGQNPRGPEGVDFNFDLDMGAADLTAVQIAGAMMKERIRPALQGYGDGIRAEFQQKTDESIGFEDEHDRLASVVDAKMETVKTLEIKFKIAHDQAETSKQVGAAVRADFACADTCPIRRNSTQRLKTCRNGLLSSRPTSVPCPCRASKTFSR